MGYPQNQIDELKKYCDSVSTLQEGGIVFLFLSNLCLPAGCSPTTCDALLCPVPREGYPSRLYFSALIVSSYTRNWNISNARIGEKNWFAFSWKVDLNDPTLGQLLVAHLNGFTKEK
jgi:hypothetical protein